MSGQATPDDDDDRGCLFLIGAVIVGICIGNLYDAVHGWLIIGLVLCAAAIGGRSK
jgi:hypothetical protein